MDDKTRYQRVDGVHNVWRCRACGHLARFEADGPYEDGWDYCPHCGRKIERREEA